MSNADEFAELFGEWGQRDDGTPLSVMVETWQRRGQLGDEYAEPYTLPGGCPQVPSKVLTVNSDGNTVAASTDIYVPIADAQRFVLNSKVVLADGRKSHVVKLATPDIAGLFSFAVVSCA